MAVYAHTNVQLLNQLADLGFTDHELAQVRAAYELAALLFSGRYEANGAPFPCHLVATASVLAAHDGRPELCVAGLLHSAYRNGDFGRGIGGLLSDVLDFALGRQRLRNASLPWYARPRPLHAARMASNAKRGAILARFGSRVDETLYRFVALQWTSGTLPLLQERLGELDDIERDVVLVHIANDLNHLLDRAALYEPNGELYRAFIREGLPSMVDLAEKLGYSALGAELAEAASACEIARIPSAAISPPRPEPWSFMQPPRSYGLRMRVRLEGLAERTLRALASALRRR